MIEYICPGCLFFNKTSILENSEQLYCIECSYLDNKTCETFKNHNKSGSKCNSCNRFIPRPKLIDDIVCPYMDCNFSGKFSILNRMNHPTIKTNFQNKLIVSTENSNKLLNIINDLSSVIEYNSFDFTKKHKYLIFQAIISLLDDNDLKSYLLNNSKNCNFQHKIFQKYISLLMQNLPFSFRKKSKMITVSSLLDDNLNIFDGISEFISMIDANHKINNCTKEFYIGGREKIISKQYYIGYILNIINIDINKSLMSDINEYNFSQIKMKSESNISVKVSHLRLAPHYSVGALARINSILESIKNESKNRNI